MHSAAGEAHGPTRGADAAKLRAAVARETLRRTAHLGIDPLSAAGPATLGPAGADPMVSVRQRAWLIPKGPFIALWRLSVALVGIAGVLLLALLLAAGLALAQMQIHGG